MGSVTHQIAGTVDRSKRRLATGVGRAVHDVDARIRLVDEDVGGRLRSIHSQIVSCLASCNSRDVLKQNVSLPEFHEQTQGTADRPGPPFVHRTTTSVLGSRLLSKK